MFALHLCLRTPAKTGTAHRHSKRQALPLSIQSKERRQTKGGRRKDYSPHFTEGDLRFSRMKGTALILGARFSKALSKIFKRCLKLTGLGD